MRDHGVEIHSLIQAKLIDQFKAGIEGWSWDAWLSAGSSDREEVAANAIAEVGLQVGIEEAYDLFYEWIDGLGPEDFGSDLEESSTMKTYRISYYEDGVKRSFTVQARSKAEAEQIGWSRVDADSIYVSEE